ncbi:unnamed protein product [Rhizophagus irregularis]|uniref:Uncharacterized protein n=1 Tax=Rhizophagus irregularis TaxID=588596 RepID=A0A915Z1V7_9GLOM|nr:unnamed protein product [Rhizophagus irregularis]
MAKFRKFLNSINYDGPIAASSDNTKLEEKLRYSATNNAIAKYVRVYILQVLIPKVLPFVLGIIPNNSENVSDVYEIHKQVLELTAHFKIHILSIGADGASVEIKAQKNIMQINTETKLEFNDELYMSQTLNSDSKNKGLLIYLFIIGELIDSYLNRNISNYERIKMVMMGDGSIPLLLWMHGSDEYFFGLAHQHLPDFTYADLIYLIPKIRHVTNAYYNSTIINPNPEYKTSCVGYICDYFEGNVNDLNSNLKIWPTDDEIRVLINDAYKEANALAKCVSMVVTLLPSFPIDNHSTSEIMPIEENSTKEFQNEEEILTEIAETIGNIASLNLQNDTDEDLIDAREQITNLSNNTYLQQVYDSNLDILDNNSEIILDLLHQQRKYHKAYTSKKMIRSQFQERDYNSSEINPSIASKIVTQVTNNNNNSRLPKARLERWDIRKRFDNINQMLKNSRELQLPNYVLEYIPLICTANISSIYPAQKGGFALALINKEICLVQILAIYYHTSTGNNHSYTEEPVNEVNLITYVSTKVFRNLQHNLFYSKCNEGYEYFCHLSSK